MKISILDIEALCDEIARLHSLLDALYGPHNEPTHDDCAACEADKTLGQEFTPK